MRHYSAGGGWGELARKLSVDELDGAELESEQLACVIARGDELGHAARIFKQLAGQVYARTQVLKQQVQTLRIEAAGPASTPARGEDNRQFDSNRVITERMLSIAVSDHRTERITTMALELNTEMRDNIAIITLAGELDAASAIDFRNAVDTAAGDDPKKLVLMMEALTFMASAGLRVLVFAKQKMSSDVDLFIVGAHDAVKETITMTGFQYSCIMLDEYDASVIEA